MRKLISVLSFSAVIGGVLMFGACDTMTNATDDESPRLLIRLTDAPRAEIISAMVSIDRVEIKGADSLSTTLTDSVQVFDLLTLQNDSSIVLVDTTIEAGIYNQLRLIVGEGAQLEFDDGSTQDLFIPSGQQSGIKILLNDVELSSSQDTLSLYLDFDATESFVFAGQSGMVLFKPVIKVLSAEKSGKRLLVE